MDKKTKMYDEISILEGEIEKLTSEKIQTMNICEFNKKSNNEISKVIEEKNKELKELEISKKELEFDLKEIKHEVEELTKEKKKIDLNPRVVEKIIEVGVDDKEVKKREKRVFDLMKDIETRELAFMDEKTQFDNYVNQEEERIEKLEEEFEQYKDSEIEKLKKQEDNLYLFKRHLDERDCEREKIPDVIEKIVEKTVYVDKIQEVSVDDKNVLEREKQLLIKEKELDCKKEDIFEKEKEIEDKMEVLKTKEKTVRDLLAANEGLKQDLIYFARTRNIKPSDIGKDF